MAALRIVVFYCGESSAAPVIEGDLSGAQQIDLLIKSVLAVNPDAALTVLTTANTDLSAIGAEFERVDDEVDYGQLMFERTRMQRDYLARSKPTSPVAFLDSDILLARDLTPVFDGDFDVALTYRYDREMPFNGGVILINNVRPEVGTQFFNELEQTYRDQQRSRLEWYGDQYALTELVGLLAEDVPQTDYFQSRGIKFRFLSCDLYNYTPPNRFMSLLSGPQNAVILHFKGALRRYMAPFWKFWLDPKGSARRSKPELFMTALGFLVTHRAYRHRLNEDKRRFNLENQDSRSWRERAEIAVDFVRASADAPEKRIRVADIGCGDCKLREALLARTVAVDYVGYDLLPQKSEVKLLDISKEDVPQTADVVVSLGVIEYLVDLDAVLRRFARGARWLVISHAAKDLAAAKARTAKRLDWQTYLTTSEFDQLLESADFEVVDRRITPDEKTCVWLARGPLARSAS